MTRCHVCSSPESERALSEAPERLTLNRCLSCGFVYLADWERSLAEADALYAYYAELSDEEIELRHSAENRSRQRALLRELGARTDGRRLLDVGCGDGQLLSTAREEGWIGRGIDLCEPAIELCHRRGLPASTTDFFDRSLDDARFDVIVMSELVEHVPEPQRFLQRAEALLERGGVLYLTTPNFGSLARRTLGAKWPVIHPEHIGYFDRTSLRAMIRRETTLREIRIDANNLSPSTLIRWLRPRGSQAPPAQASEAQEGAKAGIDQKLRRVLHDHPSLRTGKDALNRVISRTGLGDTLVALAQKPTA